MPSSRATGAILALCLGSSQAALLVLSPVLAAVATDLDVSTATAGQLRSASGLAAGGTALLAGLAAARFGLREVLGAGVALVAAGSLASAVAPTFWVLGAAQVLVGVGVGLTYAAAVAAAAEWSAPGQRSRVLSIALLGPPIAWIVGMPVGGIVGAESWRLAWIAVPLAASVVAGIALLRSPSSPPAETRAGLRRVLATPGVGSWSLGELLANSAWVGTLVFVGALFVESYGLSVATTGLLLGAASLVYVPGNLLFRRWIDDRSGELLVTLPLAAAVVVALLGAVRPAAWFSFVAFAALAFLAGGRTLAGNAAGLDLAPGLRLGVTGLRAGTLQFGYFVGAAVGGLALGLGGYGALGLVFAALYVAATVPHVWLRSRAASPAAPLP